MLVIKLLKYSVLFLLICSCSIYRFEDFDRLDKINKRRIKGIVLNAENVGALDRSFFTVENFKTQFPNLEITSIHGDLNLELILPCLVKTKHLNFYHARNLNGAPLTSLVDYESLIKIGFLACDIDSLPPICTEITDLSWIQIYESPNINHEQVFAVLANMKNLEVLYYEKNQLKQLPESILRVRQLKSLNLNENQLTDLPALDSLKYLYTVDISWNSFTEYPLCLTNLRRDKRIDIVVAMNKIKEIPLSVFDRRYRIFNIYGNPLNAESLRLLDRKMKAKYETW